MFPISFTRENNGRIDTIVVKPNCQRQAGNVVEYRDRLLNSITPTDNYYGKLKELYKEEKNPILIHAISKYKNDIDTTIVIKGLIDDCYSDLTFGQSQVFWTLKAIYENPKEVYFKHLYKLYDKNTCLNTTLLFYYLTILKYENKQTIKLLKKIIKKGDLSNTYNRVYIWLALKETDSKYFRKFAEKVKITDEEMKWVPNALNYHKQAKLYIKSK